MINYLIINSLTYNKDTIKNYFIQIKLYVF